MNNCSDTSLASPWRQVPLTNQDGAGLDWTNRKFVVVEGIRVKGNNLEACLCFLASNLTVKLKITSSPRGIKEIEPSNNQLDFYL